MNHNHLTQGDVVGCPTCDKLAGRAIPLPPDQDEADLTTPAHVEALQNATHRIVDERPVCTGGREAKCHWYPDVDDCVHESWPCGHEYVFHEECWIIVWLDACGLSDTAEDSAYEARVDDDGEDLRWPNGVIDYEWCGDYVTWSYASIDPDPEPSTPLDGRRDSDVPLWEEPSDV
jgi:hypothetical protein